MVFRKRFLFLFLFFKQDETARPASELEAQRHVFHIPAGLCWGTSACCGSTEPLGPPSHPPEGMWLWVSRLLVVTGLAFPTCLQFELRWQMRVSLE